KADNFDQFPFDSARFKVSHIHKADGAEASSLDGPRAVGDLVHLRRGDEMTEFGDLTRPVCLDLLQVIEMRVVMPAVSGQFECQLTLAADFLMRGYCICERGLELFSPGRRNISHTSGAHIRSLRLTQRSSPPPPAADRSLCRRRCSD